MTTYQKQNYFEKRNNMPEESYNSPVEKYCYGSFTNDSIPINAQKLRHQAFKSRISFALVLWLSDNVAHLTQTGKIIIPYFQQRPFGGRVGKERGHFFIITSRIMDNIKDYTRGHTVLLVYNNG